MTHGVNPIVFDDGGVVAWQGFVYFNRCLCQQERNLTQLFCYVKQMIKQVIPRMVYLKATEFFPSEYYFCTQKQITQDQLVSMLHVVL